MNNPEKPDEEPGPHEKPVSLSPLDPDEAVADLLKVKAKAGKDKEAKPSD